MLTHRTNVKRAHNSIHVVSVEIALARNKKEMASKRKKIRKESGISKGPSVILFAVFKLLNNHHAIIFFISLRVQSNLV